MLPLPGSLFGLTVTTSELAIVVALAIGASAAIADRSAIEWRTAITAALSEKST